MLRLETDPHEVAFAAQDTSELMVVHRVVQGLEGHEELKARVYETLGKVIDSEMIPEQEPFYGEEAGIVLDQLRRIAFDKRISDAPAAHQMIWEFHNPEARTYVLGLQRAREEELARQGAPGYTERLMPIKAWRAVSANQDSAPIDMSELFGD